MYRSNFSKLIDRIRLGIKAEDNSIIKCLTRFHANESHHKTMMKGILESSQNLRRQLTPTRAQVKKANQKKMQHFRKSLNEAVMSKSITGLEAIKLENAANTKAIELSQLGLI